jgi:two-component system CheB/CheR fusion protein
VAIAGEKNLDLLFERVKKHRGMDFSLYRRGTVERRLQSRLRATGCSTYSDYLRYLEEKPAEYDRLIHVITINVTEFFRDPEVFHLLQTKVIPEIIRFKEERNARTIRVWSAGTSCGEEAYGVAILFLEELQEKIRDFHLKIYGTDVDSDCILAAKKGVYLPENLKQLPRELREKYFQRTEEGYAVTEEIKRRTSFKVHNLVSDPLLTHIDLILCRNVLIYFTRPLQEAVQGLFFKALREGGFLVLGRVESLCNWRLENFNVIDIRERIYRKKIGGSYEMVLGSLNAG